MLPPIKTLRSIPTFSTKKIELAFKKITTLKQRQSDPNRNDTDNCMWKPITLNFRYINTTP